MKDQRNDGEFHRADPGRRRAVIGLLVATAVLGIAALVGLQLWLDSLRTHVGGDLVAYHRALSHALAGLCAALAMAGLCFGIWMFRLASATRADRRWPPSSMRTSSDVRIRYLTSADALVTQLKAGAVALVVAALALLAWAWWLLSSG